MTTLYILPRTCSETPNMQKKKKHVVENVHQKDNAVRFNCLAVVRQIVQASTSKPLSGTNRFHQLALASFPGSVKRRYRQSRHYRSVHHVPSCTNRLQPKE
uniref:Uncharacterized protein n=1 Tax=Rhipicephalus zambeziensis TaxID=60191 RepID=A0A224Y8F3_9ACAR